MKGGMNNMNKKFLMFGVVGLFAVGLVVAISYYALFSVTFEVLPSIVVGGSLAQDLGTVYGGEEIIGEDVTITNEAPSEREIVISDNSTEDVEVSYVSNLGLSQKVVDFGNEPWTLTGDTANVKYTVIGDEFTAEVTDGIKAGYVLVYYKDNSDRFNSPADAIGIDSIVGHLAYEDDANNDENDYCVTGEYVTCHGAKLWYVPEGAVDTEGVVDWSQASSFLFETELIQYNSDGEIVIYPGQTLTLTPMYKIGDYVTGEKTITTTVA